MRGSLERRRPRAPELRGSLERRRPDCEEVSSVGAFGGLNCLDILSGAALIAKTPRAAAPWLRGTLVRRSIRAPELRGSLERRRSGYEGVSSRGALGRLNCEDLFNGGAANDNTESRKVLNSSLGGTWPTSNCPRCSCFRDRRPAVSCNLHSRSLGRAQGAPVARLARWVLYLALRERSSRDARTSSAPSVEPQPLFRRLDGVGERRRDSPQARRQRFRVLARDKEINFLCLYNKKTFGLFFSVSSCSHA